MAEEVTLGDVDLTAVKARTVSGVVTLISRSFLLQLVATAGFFFLSVFLGRPEIGLFIAINDLVSILGYFSDIGLAASLIQKRGEVTVTDLRTTFTIQQVMVLVLIAIMSALAGPIFAYYHVNPAGTSLYYALLLAFFLASLKTVPSVILERRLNFQVLAAVEVVENVVFYLVAVLLAWKGWGIGAYVWAVTLRGIIGTSLIYLLSPWKIGLAFSISSLKSLLSFGLPYQVNSLLAIIKDRFLNVFLWKIIGAEGVGIIGWAQTWSQKPLRFIMDNVTKVTFPSFSRLQDHPDRLRRAIEKTLLFITGLTFPILGWLLLAVPFLVRLVPKWEKWEVAIVPLALLAFNSALASVSTPLTSTLNALGKVKINTYLMTMWTALTWGLTPYLAIRFGYLGVAYATAAIALSSVVPVIIVRRLTGFSLLRSVALPTLAVVAMLVVGYKALGVVAPTWTGLVLVESSATAAFVLVLLALGRQKLIREVSEVVHVWRKK